MQSIRTRISQTSAPLLALVLVAACGGGGSGSTLTFEYVAPAPTYTACAAIAQNVPTFATLVPTAFSVAPPLPSGLVLDPVTGVVSGTPDELVAASEFVVTAATNGGTALATITIAITPATPEFEYGTANQLSIARGVGVDEVPITTNGSVASWAVSSGTLPAGLALDPSTGRITGATPFEGSASFTITGTDCVGVEFDADVDVTIETPRGRGLWISNGSEDVISSFVRRSPDGGLVATGFVPPAGGDYSHLAAHPSGLLLFAVSDALSRIEVLSADPDTGRLESTGEFADLGPAAITALATEPRGASLYATTDDGHVHQFSIETDTGELSQIAPSINLNPATPTALLVHPSGDFVYSIDPFLGLVDVFDRDSVTGQLAATISVAPPSAISTGALRPAGDVLYLIDATTTDLHGYDVDPLDGSLTISAWSPFTLSSTGSVALAIGLDGTTLYVTNGTGQRIDQFDLDEVTGAPNAMTPASVTLQHDPNKIDLDPRSESAYVLLDDGSVAHFDIDAATGHLSAATNPRYTTRGIARDLEFQPSAREPVIESVSAHVLDVPASADVVSFTFDPGTGILASASTTAVGPEFSWGLAVHPRLARLYASHDNSLAEPRAVVLYSIEDDESLVEVGGFGTNSVVDGLTVDPSGRFLYLSLWLDGEIQPFSIDPDDGTLLSGTSVACGAEPEKLAVHPGGAVLLVPENGSDSVSMFRLDPTSGIPTLEQTAGTATLSPGFVAFHPSGRFFYVATLATGSVEAYSLDLSVPSFSPIGAPHTDLGLFRDVAVSPNGRYLVAGETPSGEVGVWSIDLDPTNLDADGSLTFVGSTTQIALGGIESVAFDASGQFLCVTAVDGALQVHAFDPDTGTITTTPVSSESIDNPTRLALRTVVR